jgi:integrase
VKAADVKAFRGLSFREIIEANKLVKKPAIGRTNTNKYLAALASFATWLVTNEYIDNEVMSGMYLSVDKNKKNVFPFTERQLQTIFSSSLFGKCVGDRLEHKEGNVAIRDWRYWMPWIALYSGARLGEIAQLSTTDVRRLHGVWIFHITEEVATGEGDDLKSTKTDGSQRVVPVHSELIKLGFLQYHAEMVARGEQRLFPELKRDSRGFFGKASKFFNGYFEAVGVKVDKKLNFHSLRHGIADAFRRAGYLDEEFNVLLGHTKRTTTGVYGILPQGVLSQRVEMIEAVRFSGL